MKRRCGNMRRAMNKVSGAAMLLAAAMMVFTSFFAVPPEMAAAEDEPGYIYGTAEVYSTADKDYLMDGFYYSDSWFDGDPEEENDSLALVSMQLTAAALDDEEDGAGAKFLGKLGFDDIHFENFATEDPDDCAYTWAKKKVGDSTLIAVIVQSFSFNEKIKGKGWKQNFTVNGETAEGRHEGFSKAEQSVIADIAALSEDEEGGVKYWVMGHSRGGALANLISSDLPDEVQTLTGSKPSVFAYTFEAPANTDGASETPGYIHNYKAYDDIVTMVPPAAWGMGVSGQQHDIKTEDTDAKVNEELAKLGSKSKLPDEPAEGGELAEEIIGKLVSDRIPDREDYTAVNTEQFTMPDGRVITVEYTPQDAFIKLMDIIYGEDKISTKGLGERLQEAVSFIEKYVCGYLTEKGMLDGTAEDSWALYYQAAEGLCDFLAPEEGELPFDADDAYKILRIAAPVLIDEGAWEKYPVTEEEMTYEEAFEYIKPGMKIVDRVDDLVFSHHFATSIARLKVLAPSPSMGDIAIEIPEPLIGDAVSKAPRDADAAVSGLGYPWLDSSVKWETDDPALKKNKRYYLDITYYVSGHSVPEDCEFTLNGESPCGEPEIRYRDGVTTVSLAYQFDMGTPEEYSLIFHSDHGEEPSAIVAVEGTKLKYVEAPVIEDEPPYHFAGWMLGDNGGAWDKVTVGRALAYDNEIDFFAVWTEMISKISMKFTVPKVGQSWDTPELPKNAPYHIEDAGVFDSDYNRVGKIRKKGKYSMEFKVVPNSARCAFLEEDEDYAGTFSISGAADYVFYYSYERELSVTVYFTPLDNSVTALQKGGSFKAADKVIRGSKSNKSLKGSAKSPLKLKAGKRTGRGIKLTWKKAKGAKKYVVYGAKYGKNRFRKLAAVKKRSFLVKKAGGKLVRGKKYKFIVVAVDRKGNVVSTSRTVTAK